MFIAFLNAIKVILCTPPLFSICDTSRLKKKTGELEERRTELGSYSERIQSFKGKMYPPKSWVNGSFFWER